MGVEELDSLLGDPWDPQNPAGHAAALAADERAEMFAEGESRLDRYGLNAEFVPAAYGGRLTSADRLAAVQRTLWRLDPTLAAGYGFSSFIGWVNVWVAGTDDQRRRAADLLLRGGRIAAAFHELGHGNDLASAEFAARRDAGRWLLNGRKEVVGNLRRAEAFVLFARTGDAAGSRSHSQFFVSRDGLPGHTVSDLPQAGSSGLRGLQLGGVEMRDCPVPDDTLLGKEGEGLESAMRAFQITRAIIPSFLAGPLDTALRAAIGFASGRRLYGATAADLPYVRAVVARAYADLLAVDAVSAVVLRALHLSPAVSLYAPAAKYLTSRMTLDAFEELRSVLGAQGYLREGRYAIFQKMTRDAASATFIHISRSACLAAMLPTLPRLARRSWLISPPAGPGLFEPGAALPPLDPDRLSVGVPTEDAVMATLAAIGERADRGPAGRFAGRFAAELRDLRDACLALPPRDITIGASPAAYALADRYSVLLAAASALGVRERLGEAELVGVLDRLAGRLGGASVLTDAERAGVEEQLYVAAAARHRDREPFDLTARRLPGQGGHP